MSDLTRTVRFLPAHDCIAVQPCRLGSESCKPGKGGSHGRGSVRMYFYLQGPGGAVQFFVFTGWGLDATPPSVRGEPMAADLGYHSPIPVYDDQPDYGPCDLVGEHCYYDGSGMNAEEPWRLLREEGDEAVWWFLEDYYAETFRTAITTPQ